VKKLIIIATAIAAIAIAFVASASAAPNQRVDLKVLLLTATGNEPTAGSWESTLKSEGVPYEKKVASADDPYTDDTFSDTLADGTPHAKYQAVIIATGGLYYSNPDGLWVSALSSEEWTALQSFEVKFGIRQITAFAYPTPEYGLNYPTTAGDMDGTTASLTASGKLAFPYLKGPVKIDSGAYGYQSTPIDATKFDTLVSGPDNSSLLGIAKQADGREEMVSTVDANQYQLHHLLLRHGMLSWVTRGVYLGYSRSYLAIHVDDIFLSTERWDENTNTTPDDSPNPIRMTPADVTRAVYWSSITGIKIDLLFNASGSDAAGKRDKLTQALVQDRKDFRWVNHTYSGEPNDDTTTEWITSDIQKNLDWAKSKGISMDKTELVFDQHSGLNNPNTIPALTTTGVKWVGDDMSRFPEQRQVGPALTVPRYPSAIYYNVAKKSEQLDEYNYLYLPPELGGGCVDTSTTTCFSQPATWSDYVNNEATQILRHVMSNDPRSHYMHQANLAEDGIMYSVFNEVLSRYYTYYKNPLVNPTHRETGEELLRENKWRAALDAGKVTAYLQNGKVTVQSTETLEVPFTGTSVGSLYGGQRSGWRTVTAGALNTLSVSDPANTGLPKLSGTVAVGNVLTTTNGTWSGTAPLTYTYQWQRCTTAGVCSNIDGERSATHTITAEDAGSKLRVVVMASNWISSVSQSESAQTAVVN
jgi:hypothetical protein